MILFKRPEHQRQYGQLDNRLYAIIEIMKSIAWNKYGDHLVVTSIYRNDHSTHSNPKPYRFIDFAILENGDLLGSENIRVIINHLFQRKDSKKTIPELHHGTAPHIHVQVTPL